MIDKLAQVSLFEGLDHATLADISVLSHILELEDGDDLISENDSGNIDLFILIGGKVEVLTRSSALASGEVVIANKGLEVLGEISWLRQVRRTATVRCIGEVEAIRIDGEQLRQYLSNNTAAGYLVMQRIACKLADRLQQTDVLLKQILWNSHI